MGYKFNAFTGNFDIDNKGVSIGDTIGGTPANGGILYADSSDTLRANHWATGATSYAGGAVTGIKLEQQVIADAPRFEVLNLSGVGQPNAFALATSTDPFSFFLTDTDTLTSYVSFSINPGTPSSSGVTFGLASGTASNPEFALTTAGLALKVPIDMNTNKITELDTPTAGGDAVNKTYADAIIPSQTGNSGKYLTTNGSAVSWGTVTASPGGSNTQVQFNNSGAFGASSSLTWDGTRLKSNSGFRMNAGSSNTIGDSDGNGSIYFDGNSAHIYGYAYIKLRDGTGEYAELTRGGALWSATAVDTGPFGGGNYDAKMVFSGGLVNTYDTKAFGNYFGGKVGAQANNDKLYGVVFRPQFNVGSYTGLTKIGTIFVTPDATSIGMIVKGTSSQSVDMLQIRNSSDTVLMGVGSGGNVGIGGAATTTSKLNIQSIPTSSAGLATGDVWSDGGTLKIV